MEFNLLSFRRRNREFTLFEVTEFFDAVEISFCRYRRFEENYSGEWEVARWQIFEVCFYGRHVSVWADVYLFGKQFPIKRKGHSRPDDLPF